EPRFRIDGGMRMGMYDYFVGKCPKCGADFSAQTKLGECEMREIGVGDSINGDYDTVRLRVKTPCSGCGIFPVVVIRDKVLVAYEDGPAERQEGLFGNFYPDGGRPDDEFNRIMDGEQDGRRTRA